MRHVTQLLILALGLGVLASAGIAQPSKGKPAEPPKGAPKGGAADAIIARLMAFDKNKDGKLTRDEITDERLLRLFDLADADKDGVVTKEELAVLAAKMAVEAADGGGRGPGGPGGPGGRGPGGPGGPGGRGPGGRGPGGFGPPQPGQILPPFLQDMLKLTAEQKKQLDDLQKDVDGKLGKILTDDQKKQLKEMREGFGRGGPGGPPPGPPPGREDDRPE